MQNPLENSIQYIKSVGPKRAELFAKIGITTIRDLLFYFPSRYLDRTNLLTSSRAYQYVLNGYEGEITILAKVEGSERRYFKGKDILTVYFRDSSGFFECVWFQGAKYHSEKFVTGRHFALSGKPTVSKTGKLQLIHPDYDLLTEDDTQKFFHTGRIIPVYTIPKELKAANIGDFSMRKILSTAVEQYAQYITETLPDTLLKKHGLISLQSCVSILHNPPGMQHIEEARKRLKYEELFYIEMLVAMRRYNIRHTVKSVTMKLRTKLIHSFLKILPYELTESQKNVLHEIRLDLEKPEPMNRLLQGDVGSGKTIVALIAMLIAVDNGYQAALMVPTEILADQHTKNIRNLFSRLEEQYPEYKLNVSLLIGGQKKKERQEELNKINTGKTHIIIGTHALFEEDDFKANLGLVVIDEQHRFGVAQRARLIEKQVVPNCLVMSATPIPRTLSMTLYGDLDISVLNEMPKNRMPVKTYLRGESSLEKIYQFIIKESANGNRSFIVYPLVEESEKLELKAAQTHYEELSEGILKGLRVGLIHGRMKWQQKEEVMYRFAQKEYDVLVSTTVIEVGIDIPDANIMVINDAHHFGLSQLHQLRGRVGRGSTQAYCILVAPDELVAASKRIEKKFEYLSSIEMERYKASVRLQSMAKYSNGFTIAEIDMKLRGPGDIFGLQQSGFPEFMYADLRTDVELLASAKYDAFTVIENDPHLLSQESLIYKNNLHKHYASSIRYAKIG